MTVRSAEARGATPRKKWHLNYFNRYFAPYFGEKVLSAITAEFADGYWGWRIGYWGRDEGRKLQAYNPRRREAKGRGTLNFTHHPSNKTLLMEQSALNQIFSDASQLRRIQFLVKLKAPRPNRSDGRRPAFDGDEWEVLTRHLHEWVDGMGRYAGDRLNAVSQAATSAAQNLRPLSCQLRRSRGRGPENEVGRCQRSQGSQRRRHLPADWGSGGHQRPAPGPPSRCPAREAACPSGSSWLACRARKPWSGEAKRKALTTANIKPPRT